MIDKYLVEKKLKKIENFLREIRSEKAPVNFDAFSKSTVFKRFVERNIELAIEQMTDLCKHFVSGLDLREPESYSQCFEIVSEAGIFNVENANTYQLMIKYRNLLIHGYDGVDDNITYGIYKKRLGDFELFINDIRKYIEAN